MFASRFTAGMENDAYLTMWTKLYARNSWNREGLTDKEVAMAELDSAIWWTYVEMNFENYRQGLVIEEAWKEMETEIKVSARSPIIRAVFEFFWRESPGDFTRRVEELLKLPVLTDDK
jgi:hypothetical protein